MSDIVERLRRRHEQAAENYGELDLTLWSEAADEIERLRVELDAYKAKGAAHIRVLAVNNDELRAEIERLREQRLR